MCVEVACSLLLLAVSGPITFAQQLQNGALRLVNGRSENEGRVEVYYDRQWGTVCDDSLHFSDADVICRQLDFGRADEIFYRAEFGEGTGPIWLDNLDCYGDEASILDCRHNGWGVHNCRHSEDASVKCKRVEATKPSQMPVRLACPRYVQNGSCKVCPNKLQPRPGDCTPQVVAQGIVEAFYNDEWKPVSLDGWDEKSAQVVCNELGYPAAYGIPTLTELWPNWHTLFCDSDNGTVMMGSGAGLGRPIPPKCSPEEIEENDSFRERLKSTWLRKLDCTGAEGRLLDCYFKEFGSNDNPSIQVATVRCGFRPHPSCLAEGTIKETYRTRGGAVAWSGRLEVYVDGEWGTICDRGFDMSDAHIACRAMGYGSARSIQLRAFSGRGTGKIHYSNLKCNGDEEYLADCDKYTGYRAEGCGHQGDVSVTCNVPRDCRDKASRMLPVPDPYYVAYTNEYVEVKGSDGWGLLCMGTLNANSASVVCKEHRSLFSFGMRRGSHANYQGVRYGGLVFCSGDEERMDDCLMLIGKIDSCPLGDVIVDCTPYIPDLVPDLGVFRRSLEFYPYIDRQLMYYLNCPLEENCLSSSAYGKPSDHNRRLLRFSSQTNNWGTADFRPILDRTQWIWHSCHSHFHSFEAFVNYDLLDIATGEKVAEGHKASFCLEDSACSTGGSRYRCGTGLQGISKNCGDLYGRHLDCQWIDVTDVPPGTYQLRQHINPNRAAPESDYRNNIVSCDVTFYPGLTYFTVTNFKHSDH